MDLGDQVSSKPSALTRTLSSTRTLPLNEEHAGQATPIKTQGAVLFFPLIFLGFFFGSVRVGLNQTRHSEGQVVVVVGFAGTDDEYYYHRFIGLSVFGSRNWQESGKGPQIANGAAYCVPDLTSHTPPTPGEHCWGGQIRWAPVSSNPSAGESGVGGERVV